jgi:hypothetical protein
MDIRCQNQNGVAYVAKPGIEGPYDIPAAGMTGVQRHDEIPN